jgi:hypothetical protein
MSHKPIRVLLTACLALSIAAPARADKYAAEFLKIPVGARAVGMGGAFSAMADDATAPFWNPSGMVFLPYKEAFLQHAEQFGNLVNHNFGSVVWPIASGEDRRSALGATLTWVGVDDILITPGRRTAASDWYDYRTDSDPTADPDGAGQRQVGPRRAAADHQRDLFMRQHGPGVTVSSRASAAGISPGARWSSS